MPKRKFTFENAAVYHILTRAIEGKRIFEDQADCYRFIFQIYAANIGRPASSLRRQNIVGAAKLILEGKSLPSELVVKEHSPLVYILSFVLVGNHYHFEMVQNFENGIPRYMQRLNVGFVNYFNLRHARKGPLFERRYTAIPIETLFQSDALLRYINVKNVLDLYQPGWREDGLRNIEDALVFLKEYPFSSFPDLFGERRSMILPPKEILKHYLGEEFLKDKNNNINFVESYLNQELTDSSPIFLEEK